MHASCIHTATVRDERTAVNRAEPLPPRPHAWLPPAAFVALAASLGAVVVITALSYRALAARSDAASAVNHTNDVQDHLHRFLSDLKDAETGQRGFLLTADERYLDPYYLALGSLAAEQVTLREMVAESSAQLHRLD